MKPRLFFISLLLFIALSGCDRSNNAASLVKITDFAHSECKNGTRSATPEVLRLKAISEVKLQVTHHDVVFNCCPGKLSAACQIEEQVILITEKETEQGCKCLCPYDLSYAITPLTQGAYTLKIAGYEPVNFVFSGNLDITIELKKTKTS